MSSRIECQRAKLTLDALDLVGTEAGGCSLVLGPGDASRANRALNVDEGRSSGRTTLSKRHALLLGRHDSVFFSYDQFGLFYLYVSKRACEQAAKGKVKGSMVCRMDRTGRGWARIYPVLQGFCWLGSAEVKL